MTGITGQCECGHSSFELDRGPHVRFFCHCTICQQIYGDKFSDVSVTPIRNVHLAAEHHAQKRKFKKFLALDRMICEDCGKPLISFMHWLPGFPLAMIPTRNLGDQGKTLKPSMHLYYGTRVEDVDDDLPKYKTAVGSMMACTPSFIGAMLKG